MKDQLIVPACVAPVRLKQFLGPQPVPALLPLLPLRPAFMPLKAALFAGEHELQAAEPGSISALPPYPDDDLGGKPRPVKMGGLAEPLSTGGRHGM